MKLKRLEKSILEKVLPVISKEIAKETILITESNNLPMKDLYEIYYDNIESIRSLINKHLSMEQERLLRLFND